MVHRDLKLENILLAINPTDPSDNLYVKVADFGLSTVKTGQGHENMLRDYCGTMAYMCNVPTVYFHTKLFNARIYCLHTGGFPVLSEGRC